MVLACLSMYSEQRPLYAICFANFMTIFQG